MHRWQSLKVVDLVWGRAAAARTGAGVAQIGTMIALLLSVS